MSCKTCPQRVPADELKDRLMGASGPIYGEGVDYCAARHIPLGRPGMDSVQTDSVQELLHTTCPVKDTPLTDYKVRTDPGRVAASTVFITPRVVGNPEVDVAPSDCRQCIYFQPHMETQRQFGWPMDLCKARGELLPKNRLGKTAKSCGVGRHKDYSSSSSMIDADSVALLPVYGEATEVKPDNAARSSLTASPDPAVYTSDRPVNSTDLERGIKAWRKLEHPKLGAKKEIVWLPIFDREWSGWTERERNAIPRANKDCNNPHLYADHQNLLYTASAQWANGFSALLIGHAGTGKSEFFNYVAWMMQVPFTRVSISSSTQIEDLFGKHLVSVDEHHGQSVTEFIEGEITEAWPRPGVLCVDEPNLGQKEVVEELRALADTGVLKNKWDRKQIIPQHEWMMPGWAMNPSYDPRYQGTNEMNEADLNRVAPIEVDFPSAEVERDILVQTCNSKGYDISNETVDEIMKLSLDMHLATDPNNGSLSFAWGMRLIVKTALGTRYQTLEEAVCSAFADRLDPDEKSQVLSVVRTISSEES